MGNTVGKPRKMSTWKIEKKQKKLPRIRNPILVEGLPGIGKVGKVAVDYIIDELNARQIYSISSHSFPHSVFVNEENLVELPAIKVYHAKTRKQNILFLAGDVQPTKEESSYEFCEHMLDILEQFHGTRLITLGGIGLHSIPKKPKVFCTGNSRAYIQEMVKDTSANTNLYGIVGPIIGVSGLLLGLAKGRGIKGVSLLAETYGHPMYLGMEGARELINILNTKLSLGINLKELDKDIERMNAENAKPDEQAGKASKLRQIQSRIPSGEHTSYIG